MQDELWKDIPGYEGLYQASTCGRIRTAENKTTSTAFHGKRAWKSRILKTKKRKRPYGTYDERVDLWKDGTHKTLLVSRLVAMTWCDGFRDGLTVNHIDGDTTNNSVQNLEWVTLKENIQKAFADGLYSASNKCQLKNETQTLTFQSQVMASKFLGRYDKYVCNCLKSGRDAVSKNDGSSYRIQLL